MQSLLAKTQCLIKLRPSLALVGSVRTTVWPSMYIDPTFNKDELKRLQEESPEEYEKLTFLPVKAAPSFVNSSVFYDPFLQRFTHIIMMQGKKATANRLIRETLYEIKKKQLAKYRSAKSEEERAAIVTDPVKVLKAAIENCSPVMITRSIKRGGATYQVPYPITKFFSTFLGMKWIRDSARDRVKPKKEHYPSALARELMNAYNREGRVYKKKTDLHKLCESNKAYAHYRWI
jgi:ribosomal protein S7p/S5e